MASLIRSHTAVAPAFPKVIEIVSVWGLTFVVEMVVLQIFRSRLPEAHAPLRLWFNHLPMLLIPYLWFRWRVAPALPVEERHILRRGGDRRLWIRTALLLVGLGVVLVGVNALMPQRGVPASGSVPPSLMSQVLQVLFQGLIVGFTEEMWVRVALHFPLSRRLPGGITLGRIHLSWAMLVTALLFGLIHLQNLLNGRSLGSVLFQAIWAAILALIIGHYYERTRSYAGAAWLHNLYDLLLTVL